MERHTHAYVPLLGTPPLAQIHKCGRAYIPVQDHMGSICGLLEEDGTKANNYTYDVFGVCLNVSEAVSNLYRFREWRLDPDADQYQVASMEYDQDTALLSGPANPPEKKQKCSYEVPGGRFWPIYEPGAMEVFPDLRRPAFYVDVCEQRSDLGMTHDAIFTRDMTTGEVCVYQIVPHEERLPKGKVAKVTCDACILTPGIGRKGAAGPVRECVRPLLGPDGKPVLRAGQPVFVDLHGTESLELPDWYSRKCKPGRMRTWGFHDRSDIEPYLLNAFNHYAKDWSYNLITRSCVDFAHAVLEQAAGVLEEGKDGMPHWVPVMPWPFPTTNLGCDKGGTPDSYVPLPLEGEDAPRQWCLNYLE